LSFNTRNVFSSFKPPLYCAGCCCCHTTKSSRCATPLWKCTGGGEHTRRCWQRWWGARPSTGPMAKSGMDAATLNTGRVWPRDKVSNDHASYG
jgi:hypothetical protein